METPKVKHKSYILRFWQENEKSVWRARLEPIGGHSKARYFANAESLLTFLKNPNAQEDKEEH